MEPSCITSSEATLDSSSFTKQSRRGDKLEEAENVAYWKERLAGCSTALALPADRARPPHPAFSAASEALGLEDPLIEKLKILAAQERVTLPDVLLAAYQSLLHRYSGNQDIVAGLTISRRTNICAALRTVFSGDPTFRELLHQVRRDVLEADAHKEIPFSKFTDVLQHKQGSLLPLFQAAFQFGSENEGVDEAIAKCDLRMDIKAAGEKAICELTYNAELFDAFTIQRMIGHYRTILEAVAESADQRISRLPILTAVERQTMLVEWNNTRTDFPQVCMHRLFEDQVLRTPDRLALVYEDRKLTFSALNQSANRLARALVELGVGPGVIVGIAIPRSIEMVVGLLAILKAGGAYAPLDPSYPRERLEFLVGDLQTPIVLCSENSVLAGSLPFTSKVLPIDEWDRIMAPQSPENPDSEVQPNDLAYVLYTSGSTGQPKGVLIPHRALVNYLTWCVAAYSAAQGSGSPVHSPIGFDLTVTSIFPPLLSGRTTVLLPEGSSLEGLAASLRTEDFSLVKLTPSHLEALRYKFATDEPPIPAKTFVIGGEAVHGEILNFWRKQSPKIRLINEYGPTESTVGCCVYELPPGEIASSTVPIGRPIANTRLYVLDGNLQPVPVGVAGELHIAGDGLALGYHRRPKQTAEKFISDPFSQEPGSRLYKTGDLVRYRADGNLEFLGRLDHQVKIRGFRIELSEVEAALTDHPAIREAVVTVYEASPGDRRLVAYLVPGETALREEHLRPYMKSKLPDYMLPSHYVFLSALPLTSNGKLDRVALPSPVQSAGARPAGPEARDSIELQLVKIWEEILRTGPIGVSENFFDLGGDSLLAAKMFARVEKNFGRKFPLGMLLHAPTLAAFAQVVRTPIEQPRTFAIQSKGHKPAFFCVSGSPIFRHLARALGVDQPFISVRLPESRTLPPGYTMADVAAFCIQSIREVQPQGPYFVGGWSDAGLVAYEIAIQLRKAGQAVPLVVLFDAENPSASEKTTTVDAVWRRVAFLWQWLAFHSKAVRGLSPAGVFGYLRKRTLFRSALLKGKLWGIAYRIHLRSPWSTNHPLQSAEYVLAPVTVAYEPPPYDGRIILFRRTHRPTGHYRDPEYGWGTLAGNLEIHDVPGDHVQMFLEPNVQAMVKELRACLEEVQPAEIARTAGVNAN